MNTNPEYTQYQYNTLYTEYLICPFSNTEQKSIHTRKLKRFIKLHNYSHPNINLNTQPTHTQISNLWYKFNPDWNK